MEEDFELLAAWQAGDQQAGNRLVRRHFSSLYRFFRTKLEDGVEDLTQQTLLALVEGRDRFREDGSFRAYLFGIARRQLMMALRSRYRSRKVFSPAETSIRELGGESDASPSQVVAAHWEQRLLLAALRSIPVDHQIVVELHYWEGMTVAEIADVIEVPSGTVKSRLSRARDALQKRIDKLARHQKLDAPTGDDLGRWIQSIRGRLEPDDEPSAR
jgi:RNA polymerase sigma-70 factor (ECF subfamily)